MDTLANLCRFQLCLRILKVLPLVLAMGMASSADLNAAESSPVHNLPPIIAQASGPAFTVIFWHDVDEDGIPDYTATYAFKDGRLQLLEKGPPSLEYPGPNKALPY